LLVVRGAPVLMVEADPARVEQALAAGELACPGCGGVLGPWGSARGRWLRGRGGRQQRVRPRRARCRACMATHVLLPVGVLLRRRDLASVIGSALLAKADGKGHRPIAVEPEVPATTVRGWLRRFAARAELIAGHFARLAAWLDPGVAVPSRAGRRWRARWRRSGSRRWLPHVGSARTPGRSSSPRGPAADGCCATPARPSRRRGSPAGSPANRRPLPTGAADRQGAAMPPADDRRQAIALFRYSLIREAADPALSTRERGALVRALAERDHLGPTGERVRVSRNTLDRWIRGWRVGGFDALLPDPGSAGPASTWTCRSWR
jgi:Helix-turn-helix domain